MKLMDRLERALGRFAIRNLMTYIVGFTAAVFLISILINQSIIGRIALVPSLVLKGEVWRLITFLFIPPSTSILWIFFALYFYYMVGNSLENEWGSLKFNLYYFIGMIATIAAVFISGGSGSAAYLNLSLFLAFAHLYPNFEILIFFILPIKVKYLAWLQLGIIAFTLLTQPLPYKAAALASIVNYLIFFGGDFINKIKHRRMVYNNRKRFFKEIKR